MKRNISIILICISILVLMLISGCTKEIVESKVYPSKFDNSTQYDSEVIGPNYLTEDHFTSNINVEVFLDMKKGCEIDEDCIAGYASCYNKKKFDEGNKTLTIDDDPACFNYGTSINESEEGYYDVCISALGSPLFGEGDCACVQRRDDVKNDGKGKICLAFGCNKANNNCNWERTEISFETIDKLNERKGKKYRIN